MASDPLRVTTVHVDLCRSGFLTNESNGVWKLIQVFSWLGTVISTATSQIGATHEFAG